MAIKTICETVREAESNYTQNEVKLSDYVSWSMNDTINLIDAYLNSKFKNGDTDSLGREKGFFNIVIAAVNIWYRATDLDRKNCKFIPQTIKSVPLAFIANVLLQNWMDKNNFGKFLNLWGRSLARYGSSVTKFVEKGDKLIPTVIPWNRMIVDQIDFDALPRIEKFYKTPAQLRAIKEYNQDKVNDLLNAIATRKTLKGEQKDLKNDFIELYEVHGELPEELLKDEPDFTLEEKDQKYVQQMQVISFVADKDGYKDFTLYKGREAQDPYMLTHLIEEDGRTLSIGAIEYLFEAQWMVNHSKKNVKDTLDLASRLFFQTADKKFIGRNVLSAIETGDIFIHEVNMPLTRVANDKPDITAQENFATGWINLGREVTNTPDLTRGITQAQPLTFGLGQILNENSNSLFEIMTENKGLDLEQMIKRFVIPHLKKQLKNKDEVVAVLDDAGIAEIDAMYIPNEAIKRYNKKLVSDVLNDNFDNIAPFNPQEAQAGVQSEMSVLGNKRFFKPDELNEKQWGDIFSDFEWDSIKVEITNENSDKKAVLQTLTSAFQIVGQAASQGRELSADERMILGMILSETGKISPLQLSTAKSAPPPQIPPRSIPQATPSANAMVGGA